MLNSQGSPVQSSFVIDAPVSPSVPPPISPSVLLPIPVPPPIPPREPSGVPPSAVLCSVCGQEIKELPRNEDGECDCSAR